MISPDREKYNAIAMSNFSGLKLFSVCPRLYYETYISKTYVEPERDYFVYGLLVDCVLTSPDELEKKYIRVDRTLDTADTLKYEVRIKELDAEMVDVAAKAEAGNKTAIKGLAARQKEKAELCDKLKAIGSMKTRQQVTGAVWDNAMETAESIKRNPSFQQLEWNSFTSQQTFADPETHRKGILDYVKFSDPVETLYSLLVTKHIPYEEFITKVRELPEEFRTGWIWDVKTTALISTFDPSIYAGQLAWYRAIVESYVGVRCQCGIIAGDKDPSSKRAQDYVFTSALLDKALSSVEEVERAFHMCSRDNYWPGAKEVKGVEQTCFRCSVCSDRPFSVTTPLIVSGPLNLKGK